MTNDHCATCGDVEPDNHRSDRDGLWLCSCSNKMPKIDFEKLDIETQKCTADINDETVCLCRECKKQYKELSSLAAKAIAEKIDNDIIETFNN